MTSASSVFVDANVLVYVHDSNEPMKQAIAEQWVDRLWAGGGACTSVQVLNECYSTLTQKLRPRVPPDAAWDYVSQLCEWNLCSVDINMMVRARELQQRYLLNWWDCLIVAAAQAQGCSLLLTEDLDDQGRYGNVKVCNPFRLAICDNENPLAAGAAALTSAERTRPALWSRRRRRISPSRLRETFGLWARSA